MRKNKLFDPDANEKKGSRRHLFANVFMWIGILTVLYLLITQVLMRILALLTP